MNSIFDSPLLIASRQPDLVDEVSDTLTYLGFLKNGDTTKCLIQRIQKTGTVTTFQYPNGSLDFSQDWAGRAGLNYNFKK